MVRKQAQQFPPLMDIINALPTVVRTVGQVVGIVKGQTPAGTLAAAQLDELAATVDQLDHAMRGALSALVADDAADDARVEALAARVAEVEGAQEWRTEVVDLLQEIARNVAH